MVGSGFPGCVCVFSRIKGEKEVEVEVEEKEEEEEETERTIVKNRTNVINSPRKSNKNLDEI